MLWPLVLASYFCIAAAQFGDDNSLPVQLPIELQSKLNDTDVEKIKTQYTEYFKKKCEDSGHSEVYDNVQEAFKNFTTCLQSLVDVEVLEQEIEAAKPNGTVDEVFKKYCDKREDFKGCFRKMTDAVQPCFTVEEQNSFATLHNVSGQLAEFVCFKDGERIALFIAEGGKECFQEQSEHLQTCFNSTFDSETQNQLKNLTSEVITSPFQLEFKEKQCHQIYDLQKCMVGTLENCVAPTTANIVESLFKYIRKGTPCSEFQIAEEKSSKPSNGNIISVSVATALMTTLVFMLG